MKNQRIHKLFGITMLVLLISTLIALNQVIKYEQINELQRLESVENNE